MDRQQREQQLGNVLRRSRVCFHSNHPKMFRQWQDNPITEMTIEGDERSFLPHGSPENLRVISPCMASLGRADNIMACIAQK